MDWEKFDLTTTLCDSHTISLCYINVEISSVGHKCNNHIDILTKWTNHYLHYSPWVRRDLTFQPPPCD